MSIEEDVNELKILLFQDRLTNYGKRKMINYYENEIARQKQINEEYQKINGELREQVRMLEEDIKEIKESIEEAYRCYEYDLDYSPFSKGIAEMIENILAEREQDKKRIQELEKERDHWHGCFIVAMENSIAKEKVIEAFEDIEDYFDRLNGPDEDMDYIRQVKQELLGGESK